MANKTKQRFVELKVDEVSLVDTPANEMEFSVIKRLQEVGEMPNEDAKKNEEQVTKSTEETTPEETPEKVSIDVAKAESEAVEKAMTQVTELVASIAKAVGADGETDEGVEKSADGEAEGNVDKADVKKGEEGEEDTEAGVREILEALAVGIQKAKAFTPSREAALKQALETLTELAKELGMQTIPVGTSPKTTVPSGTMFGASGTVQLTKALEGLKDMLGEMQKTQKSLDERLETVEKTRNPSQSVEDDGGTDEQKTEKSFWSGIL